MNTESSSVSCDSVATSLAGQGEVPHSMVWAPALDRLFVSTIQRLRMVQLGDVYSVTDITTPQSDPRPWVFPFGNVVANAEILFAATGAGPRAMTNLPAIAGWNLSLSTPEGRTTAVAVNGSDLFSAAVAGDEGVIYRTPLGAGASTKVREHIAPVVALAAGVVALYWSTEDGTFYRSYSEDGTEHRISQVTATSFAALDAKMFYITSEPSAEPSVHAVSSLGP